jgi:hypothetical protein
MGQNTAQVEVGRTKGGLPLAKVPPYHVTSLVYPPHRTAVYHDHDTCPEGTLILPQHRISGTGRKSRCLACIELGGLIDNEHDADGLLICPVCREVIADPLRSPIASAQRVHQTCWSAPLRRGDDGPQSP